MIMVGELFITFCERSIQGAMRALEIWAYPDSTVNLVVATEDGAKKREAAFPCAQSQLQSVIDGRRLTLENGAAVLRVQRCEDYVSADYYCAGDGWRQCIEVEALQEAVDRMRLSAAYGV
jgi:hypothetical protein